jgi:hypothetical protein
LARERSANYDEEAATNTTREAFNREKMDAFVAEQAEEEDVVLEVAAR